MLLKLLEQKFGALENDISARVRAARPEAIEQWLGRVLEAHTLDDVFA